MAVRLLAFETPDDLASALQALPAEGPLPARTVLVRSERQAHALRVALSGGAAAAGAAGRERGRAAAHLLAGTRFVGTFSAAEEVLYAAGVAFTPGESSLRPARLARLFRGVALEHFDAGELSSHPGWDRAFASTIHALEADGLRPDDLSAPGAHLRDLGTLWARVDAEAGASLTAARLYSEAAAVLERETRAWPFPGPVLAPVDGHEGASLARFLRAIPHCTVAVRRSRPVRRRWVERIERMYGKEAAGAVSSPPLDRTAGARHPTELERLKSHLFREVPASAAGGLAPSGGPDGSVDLEEHAGVEAELDATAAWVARKVLEDGEPLARIAVLVPVLDPLATLAADRIERLGLAVHVAGAVPAVATAAGARVLAVLRALRRRLPAEEVAAVLPFLNIAAEPVPEGGFPREHLSHGDGLELAFSLGTAGGSPDRPEGALDWSRRAGERARELERAIAAARESGGSDEREVRRLERTLRDLRAVGGSLEALVGVARAVHEGKALDALLEELLAFLRDAVRLPGGGACILSPLADALAPARGSTLGGALAGDEALDAIGAALEGLRIGRGRFGEAAVYVGTVAGAAGLSFDAVRVIGLSEGSIPSAPREDPVLPGGLGTLPTAEDRALAQLHAFHAVVLGARRSLVLSAPRVDLARTEREPAALLVEVAAALGRPARGSGGRAPAVPGALALRRDAFEPARESALAFRRDHPVIEADWLLRAARTAPGEAAGLPPRWLGNAALDLARAGALLRAPVKLGAQDGLLPAGAPFPAVPGLVPGRPISASALGDLLACPRRFLMKRVLGWDEPASAPPLRELDAAAFGSLLHRALERLYRAHGADIVAERETIAHWLALAEGIADRAFDEFLLDVPLLGARIRDKERARLRQAVNAFVQYDWKLEPGRRFVDVERGFGTETPLALDVRGGPLHVRGYVDRIDATRSRTEVRDVKSGRPCHRIGADADPAPDRDVQIGLYVKVVRALARAWGVPDRVVGAYAHATGRGEVEERAFRDDVEKLEEAIEGWLGLARGLLAEHAFPATPDEKDCGFCPFRALCGSEEPERATAGLEDEERDVLRAFLELKRGEER